MQLIENYHLLAWRDTRKANKLNIVINSFLLGSFIIYNLGVLLVPAIFASLPLQTHAFLAVSTAICLGLFLFRAFYRWESNPIQLLIPIAGLILVNLIQFYFLFEYLIILSPQYPFYAVYFAPLTEEAYRLLNFVLIFDLCAALSHLSRAARLRQWLQSWRSKVFCGFLGSQVLFAAAHYRVYNLGEIIALGFISVVAISGFLVLTENYVLSLFGHSISNYWVQMRGDLPFSSLLSIEMFVGVCGVILAFWGFAILIYYVKKEPSG